MKIASILGYIIIHVYVAASIVGISPHLSPYNNELSYTVTYSIAKY